MSTDSKKSFTPTPSQGDYWGGYMAEYLLFLIISVLFGYFGLDHLLLRSPSTALFKFLVNIFFSGAWWIYDLFQIAFDHELVSKYGFSTPFGPSGHGYRILKGFSKDKTTEFANPAAEYSNWFSSGILVILYGVSCLFLSPFGIPSFIAGDFSGGAWKILSLMCMISLPYHFLTGLKDFWNMGTLEKYSEKDKQGVPRTWPFAKGFIAPFLIYNDNREFVPATNMIPSKVSRVILDPSGTMMKDLNEYQSKHKSVLQASLNIGSTYATFGIKLGTMFASITSAVQSVLERFTKPPVMDKLTNKVIESAAGSIPNPKNAVKGLTPTLPDVSKGVPTVAALGAAGTASVAETASATEALTGQAAKAASAVTESVPSSPTAAQQGGGLPSMGSDLDYIILMGIGILALGGFAAAFYHKFIPSEKKEENESPPKADTRDDAPPVPGRV